MSTPTPVVVAYASGGSGHRLAAEAIARELGSTGGDAIRVEVIDALDASPAWAASLADGPLTTSPAGRAILALIAPVARAFCSGFSSRLHALQPAVIVSTHPLTTALAANLVARRQIRAHVVSAPTDFDIAGVTPRKGVDLYCAASDACAEALVRRGVDPDSVALTGIPVRPQFTVEYDIPASRAHFGLPAESRVVLAIAGSSDPEYYARLKEALAVSLPALASLPDTAVVVVAGHDAAFSAQMTSRSKGFGTTNVRILDYVEHMAPLIAASDLVVTRPVGLVCAECVDSGAPLVLVGASNAHERANAHALASAGAALFAEDPSTLSEHARKAIASPKRLARMRSATAPLARPFAAADIASKALALAGLQGTAQS